MNNNYRYNKAYLRVALLILVGSNAIAAEGEQPSMAFLNFLAEQQEVNGELIGAIDMQQQTLFNTTFETKTKHETQTKQTKSIQVKNHDEVDDNEPQ